MPESAMLKATWRVSLVEMSQVRARLSTSGARYGVSRVCVGDCGLVAGRFGLVGIEDDCAVRAGRAATISSRREKRVDFHWVNAASRSMSQSTRSQMRLAASEASLLSRSMPNLQKYS